MRALLVLAVAFAMQFCMGATYAWTIFVQPLREATGISQAMVQLPISLFYIVFPLAALIMGQFLHRLGTRRASLLGGILFAAGFGLCAIGKSHFAWIIGGIGMVAGAGCGIFYIVPVSVSVAWLPRRKGLATAIAVAGTGFSGVVWAPLAYALLKSRQMNPFDVLAAFGGLFLLILMIGASWMTYPPDFEEENTEPPALREFLKDPTFWWLFAGFATALTSGLIVSANLREIMKVKDLVGGMRLVMGFCFVNAAGRVFWGLVSDRCPPGWIVRLNLLTQAVCVGLAAWLAPHVWLIALIGFTHGGANVLYAACTARLWGKERVPSVYGWLFVANAVAAFGPWLAGLWFDYARDFKLPLMSVAAAMLILGLAMRLKPAELSCNDCEKQAE